MGGVVYTAGTVFYIFDEKKYKHWRAPPVKCGMMATVPSFPWSIL